MSRKSLQGGHCHYPDGGCALEKTDCLSGVENFSSSREMQGAPGAHGGNCLLQDTVKDIALGKCGNGYGNGSCSPNAESCADSSSFVSDTSTNPVCTIGTTEFGKCGDRCSWSPQDCNDNETWIFPVSDCTCDMVRIGGCVKDGLTYCGVSSLACDSASIWFGPTAVTAETGKKCYICRKPTVESQPTTDDDSEKNVFGGTKKETIAMNSTSTGMIVGATLGCVAAVTAFFVASLLVKRKRKNSRRAKEQQESPGTVPSNDDNGEDVSVL